MPPMVSSVSSLPAPVHTSPTSGGKPRSSAKEKRRSPVQGLPPFSLSSASSASATQMTTLCPIQAPLPPLVSVEGDAPEEGDEDAWVDTDDNDDDDDDGGDEDEEMTVVDETMWKMGTKNCRRPYRGAPSCLRLVRHHAHHQRPRLCAALVLRERGEGEELQTPVPYSYEREATPSPYSEAERERAREGEQVGGKRKR
ncbi:hypothetical protein B0H14DRAFT_1164019 [Mycena olivaceomarginata]|nr:hypothetical protein B0H14DRAFT_1164019 [Mycena olivaceomarginata]